jgi:hypothetical protein
MKTARKKPTAANLRSWRVIILRSKGEYLGSVEAPDRERAEAVAVKLFALDDDQRRRLLIRLLCGEIGKRSPARKVHSQRGRARQAGRESERRSCWPHLQGERRVSRRDGSSPWMWTLFFPHHESRTVGEGFCGVQKSPACRKEQGEGRKGRSVKGSKLNAF